jgi:hypothetical protein
MKRATQAKQGHAISSRRLAVLGYIARNDVVPHDRGSADQAWLLKQNFVRAEIEQRPGGSDWPRFVLKVTDLGREALRPSHDSA